MNKNDLKKFAKYSDKYVAYIGDFLNIIASGKSIHDVEKQLRVKKIKDATITYIPPVDKAFTPLCH